MNYLAHLSFSTGTQNSLFGNLLGDFVKGHKHGYDDAEILRGLAKHRAIDKFTDSHAIVAQSKGRISKLRRRYAGIMIDVFYDHFLAIHWDDFFDTDFQQQTQIWYQTLNQPTEIKLPERMQLVIKKMQAHDWLEMYKTNEGIGKAINGISQRIRFTNQLGGGGVELSENYLEFEADFIQFFPDLRNYVQIEFK